MDWLAFRYPGGSFQYSYDLLILTPLFFGLIIFSWLRRKQDLKPAAMLLFISALVAVFIQ